MRNVKSLQNDAVMINLTLSMQREEITWGELIEKEKSQNTCKAVRIKQRKNLSRLGIKPRTIRYAPLRSDH